MAIEVAQVSISVLGAQRHLGARSTSRTRSANPAAPLPPGERASVPIGVSINATPQPAKTVRADRPGRHHRYPSRHGRAHRAAQLDHQLRAELPGVHRVLRRGFPLALHAREARRRAPAAVDSAAGAERRRIHERDDRRLPLPVVNVKSKEALPPSDETWLFAHVHTEQDIGRGELSDLEKYLKSLQAAITTDPDKIYSRLLSPRHLEPNTRYHAFLVPAFEVGRLAGLGQSTAGVPAQKPAWDATPPASSCRSTSTGSSAPASRRISNRWWSCSSRASSTRASASGRWIARAPGLREAWMARAVNGPPARAKSRACLRPIRRSRVWKARSRRIARSRLPVVFTPNAFQDELQILVNLPETIQTDLERTAGLGRGFPERPGRHRALLRTEPCAPAQDRQGAARCIEDGLVSRPQSRSAHACARRIRHAGDPEASGKASCRRPGNRCRRSTKQTGRSATSSSSCR